MIANLAITRSLSLSSQAQAAIKWVTLFEANQKQKKYMQLCNLDNAFRNLAVIGGGQMGTGIAQVAAIAGQQV